ncbi:MAG: Uma2 family endonuclease [Armatimonadetes bacterium]|nr:Uma2 family endonuclease [Armatimonadota bacterium]
MLAEELETVRIEEHPYLIRVYGISEEEYSRITNEDTKYELVDGVLVMHSPATLPHEELFGFLSFLLTGFVRRRGLGKVYGSRATLHLGTRRNLEPDILFVATRNIHLVHRRSVEQTADLVVEILSESTREYDLDEKRHLYQQAGVGEIWLLDPDAREVIVDSRRDIGYSETRYRDGRLDSGAVGGFWLDVSWLWRDPLPDPLTCLEQILG